MATCTATARNCSATLREHRDGGGAAAREPAGKAAEGTDGDRILLFFAMAYSGGCVIHNTHEYVLVFFCFILISLLGMAFRCCSPSRCGTSFDSQQWLNRDVIGLTCAGAVYLLVCFAAYALNTHMLWPWLGWSVGGVLHTGGSSALLLLAVVAHVRAVLTDPGTVPKDASPTALSEKMRRCRRCDAFKPPRAHHCSICARCITKMDHHCPWVNNCVGVGNQKFFILFCGYIALASGYTLTLFFAHAFACIARAGTRTPRHCTSTPIGRIVVSLLVLECVLFGVFTFCIWCDQLNAALTSTTNIDRLKKEDVRRTGERASGGSRCANLREVWGVGRAGVHWFLPLAARFPAQQWQLITGYVTAGGKGGGGGGGGGAGGGGGGSALLPRLLPSQSSFESSDPQHGAAPFSMVL